MRVTSSTRERERLEGTTHVDQRGTESNCPWSRWHDKSRPLSRADRADSNSSRFSCLSVITKNQSLNFLERKESTFRRKKKLTISFDRTFFSFVLQVGSTRTHQPVRQEIGLDPRDDEVSRPREGFTRCRRQVWRRRSRQGRVESLFEREKKTTHISRDQSSLVPHSLKKKRGDRKETGDQV